MIYILITIDDNSIEKVVCFSTFRLLQQYILHTLKDRITNASKTEHPNNLIMYKEEYHNWLRMTSLQRIDDDLDATHYLSLGQVFCREVQ
jgi:hypothetical protein